MAGDDHRRVLAGQSPATKEGAGNPRLERLAQIAPLVAVAGLLALVAVLVGALVDDRMLFSYFHDPGADFWQDLDNVGIAPLVLWLVVTASFALVMAYFVDVNTFSLNAMYANRLTRCYLGASRSKRQWREWKDGKPPVPRRAGRGGAPPNSKGPDRRESPITGFDPDDDLYLYDLRIGLPPDLNRDPDRPSDPSKAGQVYWGPFPLLNTALAMVAGQELAWQDRKAASFVLSPLYCGSSSTGFRELPVPTGGDGHLTLGRAVSISGAAADPNMGFHQSPALTALMTVFNARLGWWMENPARPRGAEWRAASPCYGGLDGLLVTELFSQTNELGDYVRLIDGGHFDNLGVYELVRRRCRFIVAVDAAEDPTPTSDNLAILIRLCRTDFGINIELDTGPLEEKEPHHLTQWHCVIGRIRYDDVDPEQLPGILVYIKISMTGDEPPDLREYAAKHPGFPHDPTLGDQFFDETQFESYRALGQHIALEVFADARPYAVSGGDERSYRKENKALFSALRRRWFPPPPEMESSYLESVRGCLEIENLIGSNEHLRPFSRDLFPEFDPALRPGAGAVLDPGGVPPAPAEGTSEDRGTIETGARHKSPSQPEQTAEVHAVSQMLQVMENAWYEMHLGSHYEHPINSGWMNAFRRWTSSETVRRLWPVLRGLYSRDFVRFCETELRLAIEVWPMPIDSDPDQRLARKSLENLDGEFALEWPSERDDGRGLIASETQAVRLDDQGPRAAWLLWSAPADRPEDRFACGVILVRPALEAIPGGPAVAEGRVFELVVWMRGAYRCMGIGRHCLSLPRHRPLPLTHVVDPQPLFDRIVQGLTAAHGAGQFVLRARYPSKPGEEQGSAQEVWHNFFHYHNFRRPKGPVDRRGPLILVHHPEP